MKRDKLTLGISSSGLRQEVSDVGDQLGHRHLSINLGERISPSKPLDMSQSCLPISSPNDRRRSRAADQPSSLRAG